MRRDLVLGPDRAGDLLELVILDRPQGPAVIHGMKMRPKYRRLLKKQLLLRASKDGVLCPK